MGKFAYTRVICLNHLLELKICGCKCLLLFLISGLKLDVCDDVALVLHYATEPLLPEAGLAGSVHEGVGLELVEHLTGKVLRSDLGHDNREKDAGGCTGDGLTTRGDAPAHLIAIPKWHFLNQC